MKNNIILLPNEIIIKIFSYLDLVNQYNLSKTCISFNKLFYNSRIKHEKILYKFKINEWIDFISFMKKSLKYNLNTNNKIDEEYLLIIINSENVICYDFYKKKNLKFINIYDLINYININNYNHLVFLTHRIRLPLYLNYNIFKRL